MLVLAWAAALALYTVPTLKIDVANNFPQDNILL